MTQFTKFDSSEIELRRSHNLKLWKFEIQKKTTDVVSIFIKMRVNITSIT